LDGNRERRDITSTGGLTENELIQVKEKAHVTENLLEKLNPFFDELEKLLHDKWEELPLDDGQSAKIIKFQLYATKKLRQIMKVKITHGKQAAKKLEV